MISLADLRARNVVPTWQEAVAVVQELLHTVVASQGSAERLPDLSHIALIANGDVVALPGGTSSAHPVCHMAEVLKTLLDGTGAPPELEAFIKANLLYPPHFDTIEEFSMQLAFFERPGRRSDVEQLVSRAVTTDAQTRADDELRRLKEKAAESAETLGQSANASGTPWYASRPALVGAGVLLAVLIVGTGVMLFGRGGGAASGTSAAQVTPPAAATGDQAASGREEQAVGTGSAGSASPVGSKTEPSLVERTKSTLSRAVDYAFGSKEAGSPKPVPPAGTPAPSATQASSSARSTKASATGRRQSIAGRNDPRSQPEAVPSQPAVAPPAKGADQVNTVVTSPPLTGEPPMSVATTTELRTIIYSVADAGVIPAILLRPLLPEAPPPDVPPNQIGTLELVVDEHGDVERVRLVSPSNRFHERMLVAHAKTWKFRPAIRGGRPVKFRTVVRLTI
jgi:hypothetical protein